jgi:CDGSH-type Zn-finger protein
MSEVNIKVLDNGPLLIEGSVTVKDAEGNKFSIDPGKPSIALCRCGGSANKPFCDGAHRACGFAAANRAASG